jgi:hypothetical protein
MKRLTIIIVCIVAVTVAGGYFGYRWYQQNQLIKAITPYVKNASLRTSNALVYETETGSKITFKELFEKLESHISEIDNKLLEVQTLSTPAIKAKADLAISYLRCCQELLRAQLSKYRKQLALSSSMDWAEKSVELYRDAGYYGRDYARKHSDEALKQMRKAGQEYEEAKSDLAKTATKLIEARTGVSSILSTDILVDSKVLLKVVDGDKAKENKTE